MHGLTLKLRINGEPTGSKEARMDGRTSRSVLLVRLGAVIGVLVAGSPAAAATLEIHPLEGFTVRQSTPDGDDEVGYEVVSAGDPDTGCQVTFTSAASSDGGGRSRVDPGAGAPVDLARARARLADTFDVRSVEPFAMQGADGVVAIGDPKEAQGAVRSAIFIVERPNGRLEVTCVATADEFDAWRPLFERLARGVTLPR